MATTVVHCQKDEYDVYIGREDGDEHWGNPATHKRSKYALVRVATVEEAVQYHIEWMDGLHPDIEPERRRWCWMNLHKLKGKRLGCWCGKGRPCHGRYLAQLADAIVED